MDKTNIRNIAIIAHVDHGKTTLVDGMLKQTHTFRDNEAEMQQVTILDSNELEREKGITILAKNTAVFYKGTKINIIDTPGHADFSGEVERVIGMADGALLIVDAAEGPLPQTQFVLKQALERDLKIIVVINKIDRKDARPQEVVNLTEELFLRLAKHENQLTFTTLYGIGREGKVWSHLPEDPSEPGTLEPLFQSILSVLPPPDSDSEKPFKMLVSSLDFDQHKGVMAIGKIAQGSIKRGQSLVLMDENVVVSRFSADQVFTNKGLKRVETEVGMSGDIVSIGGGAGIEIGHTLVDPHVQTGFTRIHLEEPTLKIFVSANTSPLSGKEGKFFTARQIGERLQREKKTNIGLKITEQPGGSSFVVAGRGELHLAILFETLRREGYEIQVGKPEVIFKTIDGVESEPFEEVTIEIDSGYVGIITEEMGRRKGELLDMHADDRGLTKMIYKISSRNYLGFRGDVLTKTRGNGIFASQTLGYFPASQAVARVRNGVLISLENGKASGYALTTVQERGKAFIGPGTPVYEGMIIGVNNKQGDMEINVCKTKRLTNIHSANADIAIQLDPPTIMSLEQCLDFVGDDELLEITPLSLRLRKAQLHKVDRVKTNRT